MDQTNAGIDLDNAAWDALRPFIADEQQRTDAARAVVAALLARPAALQALLGLRRASSVIVSQRMDVVEAGSTVVGYVAP